MLNDSQLQEAILAELKWEPSVTAGHIGVAAHDGVATLTGHVSSYPHKHAAEVAARRVKGVHGVANEITVELPVNIIKTDEDIAAAALERLAWDISLPSDRIQVAVIEGWLTLSGEVDWYYQSQAAVFDVHNLRGVIGLTNAMTIKPRVDVANLTVGIGAALTRSWSADPNAISVSAEGGMVRLTGTVHSPHDRLVAANAAWSATGVTTVENDILVS
jgi:osmotically-inducible protein OsmY